MNDRDDSARILRAAATAETAAHRAGVSPAETSAALAAVRARAVAGDTGTIATTTTHRRPRPRWRPLAVAAAVIAVMGGSAVALSLRSGDDRTVVPGTDPTTAGSVTPTEPTPAPTNPSTTTAPTSTAPTTTATTTTAEPAGPVVAQPAIPYACAGEITCTQLLGTADGRILAYSPVDEALTVYDSLGTHELLRVPLAAPLADDYPSLVTVGPGDVAYLITATPGATDPSSDLIAIPLAGPSAGTVIQRWTGLDGSGDSTLVPQVDGLVTVPCCGPMETRPAPDAQRYPYVDANGAAVTSTATTFRLDLAPGAGNLVRIDQGVETVFPLPTEFQAPRDFPRVVATTDGGALAIDWIDVAEGGALCIAHFLAATSEQPQRVDVFRLDTTQVALLEPGGTVLVVDGDHFARRVIAEVATEVSPAGG